MENNAEIKIVHRKHGRVLLWNGHQFYRHKIYKNKSSIWTCSQKQKKKCNGTVTIDFDEHFIKQQPHVGNCVSNEAQNEVALAIENAKKEVTTSVEPVTTIYKKHIEPLQDKGFNILTKIPSFDSTKHTLYTHRNNSFQVQKTTYKKVNEVEIPIQYKRYLIADYNPDDGNRILLFGKTDKLMQIGNIEEFFVDGTFQSCPMPFYQLVHIHGDVGSSTTETKVIPLMFALLPSKTESVYKTLFDLIKTTVPEFKPKTVHADFELAITNALLYYFPDLKIFRCYYHYTQNLWRKSKKLNLKNKVYRRLVSLCCALPLLPQNMISKGWEYINEEYYDVESDNVKRFIRYFKTFYLKDKFIEEWCIYNRKHRTNNICESYNAKLNKVINKNYVTIGKLLHTIFYKTNTTLTNTRKSCYKIRDNQILNAQMQLISGDISIALFLEKIR